MKKSLSILLCLLIIFTTTYIPNVKASSALTDNEITSIVENYLSIVGSNRYWNANIRNNQELLKTQANNKNYLAATTTSPCKANPGHSHTDYGNEGCTSNVFTGVSRGTAQCWGFGDYMEYVIFKTTSGDSWTKHTSVSTSFKFRPGDLIWSQKNSTSQHIMVVYKTNSDGSVKIIEGNYGGKCHINTRTLNDPHSYVNYSSKSYVLTPPSSLRVSSSTPEEPETDKTPGKPALKSLNSNYWSKENITFSWNSTANTTHYNLYITKYNGSSYAYYENVFYAESGITKQLSPGNYRIQLQSTNSNYYTEDGSTWLYTDGDYMYFTVFDAPEKPVLKNMNSNYWSKESIPFSWDSTANTTHYNLYITKYNGSSYAYYENVFYAESGLTKQLPKGDYRVQLQSTNKNYYLEDNSTWLYTDGDWVYFSVFDAPEKPVLKSMISNYWSKASIPFSWDSTANTTHYNLYITKYNGSSYAYYENVFYAESGLTKQLPKGDYRVQLQSTNKNYYLEDNSTWLYTDGDWVYFSVFDAPEKPVLKNMKSNYLSNEGVVFLWNATDNTTHNNLYLDILEKGEYKRLKAIHYAESGLEQVFEPGKYRVQLQSTNRNYYLEDNYTWLYTDGDWIYFSVSEKDAPYTSSTVTKNENILTIYTELYNLTAPYEIIIVGYKNNRFVTMERVPHNEQNSPYTLEGDIDKIKVMVWSDLSTLKPLCEAEEITSDKFIIE